MKCVCGHAEQEHVGGGRCRVPDCPCEHFQPGDTVSAAYRFATGGDVSSVDVHGGLARTGGVAVLLRYVP